jgi:hypothetical protein
MKHVCLILITICLFWGPVMSQVPTFINDVAPIIHTKCTPCHRPNEAAPFSLITYEDVSKRAGFIKKVVSSGYMPPWRPHHDYVKYGNDRSLSDNEKSTIIKWVDNNYPRGTGEIRNIEKLTAVRGITSYHRKPDTTLKMPAAFPLPDDNAERFIIYKIPFELKDSLNVEAIEFYTNNKRVVHHVNYSIHEVPANVPLTSGPAYLDLTVDDPVKSDQWKPLKNSISYYGGWIPGATHESYPKGMGWVLPKRGVIFLTLHIAPLAKKEEIIAGVNLFFTKEKIDRKVKVISFGSGGIGENLILPSLRLLPNRVQTFSLTLANPGEDFSVLYVWPHMHLLGKEFKAYAVSPKGDTIRLVHIPEWDFRWQEIYRFKQLVRIPQGSRLYIKGTYDNTENNPFNPFKPPQMIFSSGNMETTNEMMTMMMVFLPYRKGDEELMIDVPKQ